MAKFAPNQIFRISPDTFNEIDDWIRAAQETGRNIQFGMNALAMLMAYTNMGFAQKMSMGPLDPQGRGQRLIGHQWIGSTKGGVQRQPLYEHTAWKIPVRRITSRYYKGWKVKRLAPGAWMLYNDSREAWFIEFGIHPTGSIKSTEKGHIYTVRVRRPVRKLSLKKTLAFVDESRVGERIWEASFAPFRPGYRYTQRGGLITLDGVQAVAGMRVI